MKPKLLLVEDDLALRTGLTDTLEQEGIDVTAAADGNRASRLLTTGGFDVVVLDLMLPGKNGLDVLREVRARDAELPVLILTAKGDESDKVIGLELGADDYVTKPFGVRELLARVRALLRRSRSSTPSDPAASGDPQFRIGDAEVDLAAFEVRLDGESHALSQKETAMLELLRGEAGKVVTRKRFLDEVWGASSFVGNRTVDTHMLNLRKKIERDPKSPQFLITVHGAGYKLLLA